MNKFKTGTAAVNITPSVGTELCGYAKRIGGSAGKLDDLFVKALIIFDGEKKAALLSCDLIGLDAEFVYRIRNAVAEKFSFDYKSIMISCTHTHSGPATMHNIGIGKKNIEYLNFLFEKCLAAIEAANRSLQPAEIFYHSGKCNIGINRRGIIKKGEIEPSEDPKGFIDNQISILTFYKENSEEIISILFNYGCHPTVLEFSNNFISADFPGAACRLIENYFESKIHTIFINGGAGNINPKVRGGADEVKMNGEILVESVLTAIKSKGEKINPLIDYNIQNVELPYSKVATKHDYNEIIKTIYEQRKKNNSHNEILLKANLKWALKYLTEAEREKIPSSLHAEIQCITIGSIAFVGIPAEVFAETSFFIKQNSNCNVFVAGYTNGNFGYLPTEIEINKGGYEVLEAHKYYDHPVNFSGKADEKIREGSLKLILSLLKSE